MVANFAGLDRYKFIAILNTSLDLSGPLQEWSETGTQIIGSTSAIKSWHHVKLNPGDVQPGVKSKIDICSTETIL